MSETYLDTLLDEHVPRCEPCEDWADVLERARHDRWRVGIVALVVAALVMVPAALAVGTRLVDWFEGKPAPTGIREDFVKFNADMQQMAALEARKGLTRKAPRAVAARAHGVLALETADGPVYLWAAPRRGGGICWLTQFVAAGKTQGGCDGAWPLTRPLSFEYGWTIVYPSEQFILGRVTGGAATVRVAFSNGETATLPVAEGLFIGAAPRHVHPLQVASYTSNGSRIAVSGTLAGGTRNISPAERQALSQLSTPGRQVTLPPHAHGVPHLLAKGYERTATLLATRGDRAYYRLRRGNGQVAYAVGPADRSAGITKLVAPGKPGFPSLDNPLVDLSTTRVLSNGRTLRFLHVGGIAADGVARVVLKDREGRGLLWLPVHDNVYDSGETLVPAGATQLDAQAADRQTVAHIPR